MIQISPSILSADFAYLARDVEVLEKAGAHALHLDVMDGHFVPNITFGPMVIQCLKNVTKLPMDVHLMISDADKYIPAFVKAGADRISVHVESSIHLHRTLMLIKSAGVRAGVALNPATPLGHISEVLPIVDFVLVMSVNPGFGGQKFITESIDKISRLHHVIKSRSLKAIISVDGGVTRDNALDLVRAGARILVAGSAIFTSNDKTKAIQDLIAATRLGTHTEV